MKNLYISKIYPFLFIAFLLTQNFAIKAQELIEIPNPEGFSFSFVSGGDDEVLFVNYNDINFNNSLFAYDGNMLNALELGNSPFSGYSNTYNGDQYLFVVDLSNVYHLYRYNNGVTEEIELPAGFEYGEFITVFNGKMYFTLYDLANFDEVMYEYDGINLSPISFPNGLAFDEYIASIDDLMYFSLYNDLTGEASLYNFDGTNLNIETSVPSSFYIYSVYEDESTFFLVVEDINFNLTGYQYEGNTFTQLASQVGLDFNNVLGKHPTTGVFYLSYFDFNTFTESLFIKDGATINSISTPAGFDFFELSNFHNEKAYFIFSSFFGNGGALYQLDGATLNAVTLAPDYSVNRYAGDVQDIPHYIQNNDLNFEQSIAGFDESTLTLNTVDGPMGLMLWDYAAVQNSTLIAAYDDGSIDASLWAYDGSDFSQIITPTDRTYSFFAGTYRGGDLYFGYSNNNDEQLYKLSKNAAPTSFDASVTTFINIPYFFNVDDFSFSDTDPGDSFTEIRITSIEQVGYLLWNGAHVLVGDRIPVTELEKLTFTPLTDEQGSPYDAFQFRVGDGIGFSSTSYTMTINVEDPTAVSNNQLAPFSTVYPIPANSETTLKIETEEALETLDLSIYSIDGQLIIQKQFEGIGYKFQETIDLSNVPVGTYLLLGNSPLGRLVLPIQISR